MIPKAEAIIPLIEQMLEQIEMTYSNRKELYINKIRRSDVICIDNTEIPDEMIFKCVCSTTSWSRSTIQLS